VTERDTKARAGTFADLRGILRDYVARQPTDQELRQWIDEARSRNLPENLKRFAHNKTEIQDTQD
jgi:hypothetical protein